MSLEINCYAEAKPFNGNGPEQFSLYLPDQRVTYFCNDGYEMVGKNTATCLSSGSWTSSSPTCKGDFCKT